MLSLQIALLSTAISLVSGTLAAIAIARGKLPGADIFATALVSPLMMPGLVLGIALLQGFRAVGFTAPWATLLVAHLVVTLPYVARTMIAGLSRFDFTLIEAARTLGCTYPGSVLRVMVPALAPSFLIAGIFSLPGLVRQLSGVDLPHRRPHQDAADQDAAIYRGSARSDVSCALHPHPRWAR